MSGSPKYCKHVQLLITKDDDKMIKELSKELKCSNSEIFRQAVRDFSQRYQAGNTLIFLKY